MRKYNTSAFVKFPWVYVKPDQNNLFSKYNKQNHTRLQVLGISFTSYYYVLIKLRQEKQRVTVGVEYTKK